MPSRNKSNRTGDEDVSKNLEQLISRLVRKDLIVKPSIFVKGMDINRHLEKVDSFIKALDVELNDEMISILMMSLDDDVYAELCCQHDFSMDQEYNWFKKRLKKIFSNTESRVSPLMVLLDVKQIRGQSLRDFVSALRIHAYRNLRQSSPDEREKLLITAFINGLYDT